MGHTTIEADHNERCYLRIPFISDNINHKIKRILKSEHLNVGLAQKSQTTLRSALRTKNRTINNCQMTSCPLKDNKLCFQKNVVYKVTCRKCQQFYIGSTIRQLLPERALQFLNIFRNVQQTISRPRFYPTRETTQTSV